MNDAARYIAKLLRTDADVVINLEEKMSARFQKTGVLENLDRENRARSKAVIEDFGVKNKTALDIYESLIRKVSEDDRKLKEALGIQTLTNHDGYSILAKRASELAGVGEGFYLKWAKAEELLLKNPPPNILSFFNARNTKELLAKEDIKKVFSALRFAENREWLNQTFFAPYSGLKPEDFERRPIEMLVLGNQWLKLAEKFMAKKYHNVSHLKELGLIFVLPQDIKIAGESLRLFTLLLHYLHEVSFYSELFYHRASAPEDPLWSGVSFPDFFVSALRGDVLDERLPNKKEINWMIVQQYLAKDDENDWRLFEPHVNPEALHWSRAEENIAHINEKFPGLDLSFWHNLDWIGDFFPTPAGDILVSFNLIDTVMSLVKEKELIKYLYHHQEALWNKIFASYAGEDELRKLIVKNFAKGYITL